VAGEVFRLLDAAPAAGAAAVGAGGGGGVPGGGSSGRLHCERLAGDFGVTEMEGGGGGKGREGVWMRSHPTSRRHLPHPSR